MQMKILCSLVLLVLVVPAYSQEGEARPQRIPGLMCYECQSSQSNKHCLLTGKVTECQYNQKSCQNTVRIQNGRLQIQKGCKQTQACSNNMKQNTYRSRLGGHTQCSFGWHTTVCRCCCQTNNCNENPLYCQNAAVQVYVDDIESNIGKKKNTEVGRKRPVASQSAWDKHPCEYNPCSNGGACVRGIGQKYTCKCATGWRDSHCNTKARVYYWRRRF